MRRMKKVVTGSLISACTLAAPQVFAAGYVVGGSPTGDTSVVGSTILSSLSGGAISCATTLTVDVVGGVARVINATFSGGLVCAGMVPFCLPWTIAPPTSAGGPDNVKIGPVCVYAPNPVNRTCTGTLTGTLSGSGKFTFMGNLLPSCMWKPLAPSMMTSTPTWLAVYP